MGLKIHLFDSIAQWVISYMIREMLFYTFSPIYSLLATNDNFCAFADNNVFMIIINTFNEHLNVQHVFPQMKLVVKLGLR